MGIEQMNEKLIDEIKALIQQHWQDEEHYNAPLSKLVYEQIERKLSASFGERISTLLLDGLIMEIIVDKERVREDEIKSELY